MIRLSKPVLKLMQAPALWGVLWLCEFIFFFLMLKEWHDYPLRHNLTLTEDCRVDGLHLKLLYAFCVSMIGLLVLTAVIFWRSLVGRLEFLKLTDEEGSGASAREPSPSVFSSLLVNMSDGYVSYEGDVVKIPPRVAVFLDALLRKEDHALSLEKFNELFQSGLCEKLGCSKTKIRNIKYSTRLALKSMPFDVVSDTSGRICLVYTSHKDL